MMKSNQQRLLILRICLKISVDYQNHIIQLIKSNTADSASAVAAAQGIAVDKNSGKEKSIVMVQQWNKIYFYIAPFFPFSIGLAITHILMLILIAIRMYADNFNI